MAGSATASLGVPGQSIASGYGCITLLRPAPARVDEAIVKASPSFWRLFWQSVDRVMLKTNDILGNSMASSSPSMATTTINSTIVNALCFTALYPWLNYQRVTMSSG